MNRKNQKQIERLLELLGGEPKGEINPDAIEHEPTTEIIRKNNKCGKMCYPSEAAARKAVIHRMKVGANVTRLRHYWCGLCASWHMTSSIFKKP